MTKVAQIEDRGAAVAWSPIGEYGDVIALGAKVRALAQTIPIRFFSNCACLALQLV